MGRRDVTIGEPVRSETLDSHAVTSPSDGCITRPFEVPQNVMDQAEGRRRGPGTFRACRKILRAKGAWARSRVNEPRSTGAARQNAACQACETFVQRVAGTFPSQRFEALPIAHMGACSFRDATSIIRLRRAGTVSPAAGRVSSSTSKPTAVLRGCDSDSAPTASTTSNLRRVPPSAAPAKLRSVVGVLESASGVGAGRGRGFWLRHTFTSRVDARRA